MAKKCSVDGIQNLPLKKNRSDLFIAVHRLHQVTDAAEHLALLARDNCRQGSKYTVVTHPLSRRLNLLEGQRE